MNKEEVNANCEDSNLYERLENMDSDEECEFSSYLEELIKSGAFEGEKDKVKGITLKVIDRGYGSLSDKQKYVFREEVYKHLFIHLCSKCSCPISWSEMFHALKINGLCSSCRHDLESIDKWD